MSYSVISSIVLPALKNASYPCHISLCRLAARNNLITCILHNELLLQPDVCPNASANHTKKEKGAKYKDDCTYGRGKKNEGTAAR